MATTTSSTGMKMKNLMPSDAPTSTRVKAPSPKKKMENGKFYPAPCSRFRGLSLVVVVSVDIKPLAKVWCSAGICGTHECVCEKTRDEFSRKQRYKIIIVYIKFMHFLLSGAFVGEICHYWVPGDELRG